MMGSKRNARSKKRHSDTTKDTSQGQKARTSWKLKYELINSDQFGNGTEEGKSSSGEEEQQASELSPPLEEEKKMDGKKKESRQKTTVIAGLSGYLSSSDSDSESSGQEGDINIEVQAFLKEIDRIKLDKDGNPIEPPVVKDEVKKVANDGSVTEQQQQAMQEYYAAHGYSMPTTSWQECYDSSSGYSYYWNVDSNEVRWEIPEEYQLYIDTVKKQWEEYNRSREEYNRSMYPTLYPNIPKQTENSSKSALIQSGELGAGREQSKLSASTSDNASNKGVEQRGDSPHLSSETSSSKSTTTERGKRKSLQSDSEDEKIELITSYGPNSDDQSSEDDSQGNDSKKTKRKKRHSLDGKEKNDDSYSDRTMGPSDCRGQSRVEPTAEEIERQEELKRRLACRQEDVKKLLAIKKEEAMKNKKRQQTTSNEGPSKKKQIGDSEVNQQDLPQGLYKPDLPTENDASSPGEIELVERLKSQAELLKKLGGEVPEGVSRIISEQSSKSPKKDTSLVAGYGEDLDSETEEGEITEGDKDLVELKVAKLEELEDYLSKQLTKEDKAKADVKQVAAAGERVSKKVLKLSAKTKQLINASDTTKRARQTDFVDTPLGLRPANSTELEQLSGCQKADDKALPETKGTGFGYSSDSADKTKPSKLVQFVSADSSRDSGDSVEVDLDVDIEDHREVLMGKMKFLSEGKETPSPVQIWAEQLEILYKAWETKCLKGEFLSRWLQTIGERLTQLEATAAPPGWLCLWSREERRYCYKRVETGEVVWDFPVTTLEESTTPPAVVTPAVSSPHGTQPAPGETEEVMDLGDGQGEVEMDLCMTPPPPPTPPSPPPAPIISLGTPSPPPAPVISFPSDTDYLPPLPEETPPPLPEEAPPPLPDEAPPLPLDEAPPLPPGEPLPPGVEPPQSEIDYTPPLPPTTPTPPPPTPPAPAPVPSAPPAAPAPAPPVPVPPPVVQPHTQSHTQAHRALLPHPPPQDYSHIVMTPASYHHLAFQMHYGPQSQFSSAYVSAAPMPAQAPPKPPEAENKTSNLSMELDSFYSDLATLEPEESEDRNAAGVSSEETAPVTQDSPEVPPPTSSSPDPTALKKRKKPKLAPGLALKKKGVSSLVAKWQKVQQSSRRDF